MKSKITKLAAVAAVILIAVAIGYWADSAMVSKVYAMSDVPELFNSAKTLYLSGRIYFPPAKENGEIRAVDVEHWVDIENSRWRSITPGASSGPDGVEIYVSERICDGTEFVLNLDHIKKQAGFSKISQIQRKMRSRGLLENAMVFVCGDPELYDLYQIVGEEQIDGQIYNIWELSIEQEGVPGFKMHSWLSPTTGDFAKAVVWIKESEGNWNRRFDINVLERNITIPDSVFAMDIPDDYSLTNTRQTAPKKQLSKVTGANNSYQLNMHILFTLQDGSVIACWSSENRNSEDSQAHLFADTEMGGDLPKLPFEVYALEASVNGSKEIFEGRHLCYTELDGKFYEWGIYTPAEKIDYRQSRTQSYSVIYRVNCESEAAFRLATGADLLLRSKEDFETFVLGTMAELSDNQQPPDNITYEQVMLLTEQIRQSMTD